MKKLYIHIGLSKTGTSAIQSWLSLNADKLKKQGIMYADLNPSAKKGKITSGNGVELFRACEREDWVEVGRLIEDVYLGEDKVGIVSSETLQNISKQAIEKIKFYGINNGIEVKVIAYARSVYELIYSNYLQGVKRHGYSIEFECGRNLTYKQQRTFLENFSSTFEDQFVLLNYDMAKENLFESIANVIGFEKEDFIVKNKKVNRSLTFEETEILRELNKLHQGRFSTEISDYIIAERPDLPTKVYYTENHLDAVEKNSKDDLAWINENLSPIGGDIQITLGSVEDCVYHKENASSEDKLIIIDSVISWVKSRTENSPDFVNFIRDFAVFIESYNIEKSFELMSVALKYRPDGPFIKKKCEYYKTMLEGVA